MASGPPRKSKVHVLPFHDHAGSPALSAWRGRAENPLPRLYSYSIYFTHASVSPDSVDAERVFATVTNSVMYGSGDVEYRLDMYFLPTSNSSDGSAAEDGDTAAAAAAAVQCQDACIRHYRAEKAARGSFTDQVDRLTTTTTTTTAGAAAEPTGGSIMPGLVPSYIYDTLNHRYHSLLYIYREPADSFYAASPSTSSSSVSLGAGGIPRHHLVTCLEFDPMSQAQYESDSKDPDDPREPDVLPDKRVTQEVINETAMPEGVPWDAGNSRIRSMATQTWDRAPRERMGEEAFGEAARRGWTSW